MSESKRKTSNNRSPAKPVAAQRKAHQIRIIGGQWKRTPITVVDAEGLRPTPDRVRETVFNWLTHLLDANWSQFRVLDLFAGSGALGFEAASRGAASVKLVEAHTPAFRQLETIKDKLQAQQVVLQRGDALTVAQALVGKAEKFDLIFLDPPFAQGFLPKVVPLCAPLLSVKGYLYVESEQALPDDEQEDRPDWLAGWRILRADKAGSVFFHILQRNMSIGSQS